MARGFCVVALCALVALSWMAFQNRVTAADAPAAIDDEDFSAELPRIPPVEPRDAEATFVAAPGFRVEQVAAEPLVDDPIAMAFDENGRLYVVEMQDYSEDAEGRLGKIHLLADTDGDGHFDTSSVFAENLSWPTAVICYDGGIFVGAAPDILYCKDNDGDGRADVTQRVFTGFGRGNVQGLLNSFAWGLDNRIHGATSSAGAAVRRADDEKARPVNLSGRDFAFDPRTLVLTPTSGGGQYGMSFDAWGRKFVCSNSDHIQLVMFEDRYVARNPYLAAPSPRVSIAADGPAAEIYRASPVEPWRVVRTRLRVAGKVPGPIEGGGRASGYFTGATGITIYRGDAWPADAQGLAIVGDACTNLVHRKRLEPNGLELVARRIDAESEFVASRDIWFRPVQFANAPDGTLYIADMYREVIEHPLSLPPVIKRHLDLTSGRDRGRIYRIVPDGYIQRALPRLGQASTEELVATLAHKNAWHRETAARLLYQRRDRKAVAALVKLAMTSDLPEGRMHALYALAGLDALTADVVLAVLGDADPRVRAHAVRLAEGVARSADNDVVPMREKLLQLAQSETDLHVVYQLLFSLGELPPNAARDKALATLARRDPADRWMRLALVSSLAAGVADVFQQLAADESFRRQEAGQVLLTTLAQQAGSAGRNEDLAAVIAAVEALPEADRALTGRLVRGLSEGAARQGGSLERILAGRGGKRTREVLANLVIDAQATARDNDQSPAARVPAIQMLALGAPADALPILTALVDSRQPQEVQLAALTALGRIDDPAVSKIILDAWPTLSPRLRSQAAEALLARAARVPALLDAIEGGQFKASDLEPARVQQLLAQPDAAVRARATALLGTAKSGKRQEVVEAYRPALSISGDPAAGKRHFQKVCAACHRVEGIGYEIGANLAAMKNRGPEAILVNLLDPNREVNPQFINYTLTTGDGRILTGMIDAETATSVTLKRGENATDTVLRVNIDELSATGQSLMPEGLEQQLDRQAVADLIAYLMSLP
ncbi:MAG TPA: PVC-type heme-binding CxxCH protein [Pirellulales bacterium]|nr:PVC-type heme-binding CxxCH protein [Pirellulales bacterium]